MENNITSTTTEQRAVAYRWLSGMFFRELTEEQILSYQDGEGQNLLGLVAELAGKQSVLSPLRSHLNKGESGNTAIDLACEYARLFLGAGGPRSVPPYASVFTSKSCSTHQQSETDAARIMAEYGLGVRTESNEPADHVAALLEFMAFLCVELESSSEDRVSLARQKTFVENHLLNWIPEFVNVCKSSEPEGFYPHLAELTLAFLETDRRWLDEQLGTAITTEIQ